MFYRQGPAIFLAPLLLCACSPVYVYQSAAGHAKLLWGRRDIARAVDDPKTPSQLKPKLKLVSEIRAFAFGRMHLKSSRDYSTYSVVDGEVLSYLVSASPKTRLESYIWWFPIAGSFPYRGYFKKQSAEREKLRLEKCGYDATIGGAAAYNTPLWFSDPVPSNVLADPPGELAALLIHELAHGTIFIKNKMEFNESMATFIGEQGAEEFLLERFGAASKELAGFKRAQDRDNFFTKTLDEIYGELEGLYKSSLSEDEKLKRREPIFARGRARLNELGFKLDVLNNAVILAHKTYHKDLDNFKKIYEDNGRDWAKTIEYFWTIRSSPSNLSR